MISFAFFSSVDLMSRRLDPEGLGIILLNAFMDEFFQQEKRSTPDTFDLLHYNGIPGSNDGNKVSFEKGSNGVAFDTCNCLNWGPLGFTKTLLLLYFCWVLHRRLIPTIISFVLTNILCLLPGTLLSWFGDFTWMWSKIPLCFKSNDDVPANQMA